MKPLETIDLGDLFTFEACGKDLKAKVTLKIFPDDIPYDGDISEDVEAFERGDFQMYVAEVTAWFAEEVSGTDILGGIAASSLEQITECVEEHGMVNVALQDLATRLEKIKATMGF